MPSTDVTLVCASPAGAKLKTAHSARAAVARPENRDKGTVFMVYLDYQTPRRTKCPGPSTTRLSRRAQVADAYKLPRDSILRSAGEQIRQRVPVQGGQERRQCLLEHGLQRTHRS